MVLWGAQLFFWLWPKRCCYPLKGVGEVKCHGWCCFKFEVRCWLVDVKVCCLVM